MAYITPKTNWESSNIPTASDFNRIEGNISAIVDEAITFQGIKTFGDGILCDSIDSISGQGVVIENVTIKAGTIYGLVWGA